MSSFMHINTLHYHKQRDFNVSKTGSFSHIFSSSACSLIFSVLLVHSVKSYSDISTTMMDNVEKNFSKIFYHSLHWFKLQSLNYEK